MQCSIDRLATGGEGVARVDGKVTFVAGGFPGDVVDVALTSSGKRFDRGVVTNVITPSPHRVEPHCEHVTAGCGGCPLGGLDLAEQRAAKRSIVIDAAQRIGHIADLPVHWGPELAATGFRTTTRAVFGPDGWGYRTARSHTVHLVERCPILHPDVHSAIEQRDSSIRGEWQVRVASSGQAQWQPVEDTQRDDGTDEAINVRIKGHRFRVSPRSFFQSRHDGAEALTDVVASLVPPGSRVVDLGAGVGMLGALVQPEHLIAVESNRFAASDAEHNLRNLDGDVSVVRVKFERFRSSQTEVVIADPPRSGLATGGADVVKALGPRRVVLVSCDIGSFGRDLKLMAERGYQPLGSTLLDFFPHTPHVEIVTALDAQV